MAARAAGFAMVLVSLGVLGAALPGPAGASPPASFLRGATLNGVAALMPDDVWVVGQTGRNLTQTLTQHWDGTTWTTVPSPDPGGRKGYNELDAVSAESASDVWATGSYDSSAGVQAMILHWDGKTWKQTPLAGARGVRNDNYLEAVSADSPNDAWAVGSHAGPGAKALIEHWDGTSWQQVDGAEGGAGLLYAVDAISPTNVWAVGGHGERTLVEHWDGAGWQRIASPSPGHHHFTTLRGVSAASPTDVWAVGIDESEGADKTVTLHWDGTSWTRVPSPNAGGSTLSDLYAVTAISAADVWAVGMSSPQRLPDKTLIEHWDGTAWSIVKSPSPGNETNQLYGVSGTSSSDVWAAGLYESHVVDYALAEHWDGTRWTT